MSREGNIILANIPQADGGYKLRPILLLRKLPTYDDYLVCGISTQLHQKIDDFDITLLPNSINNLRSTSIVRLSFLSVLSEKEIKGILGNIELTEHQTLLKNLSDYLIIEH